MNRRLLVYGALAALLVGVLASSPTWATCPGGSPIVQAGGFLRDPGVLLSGATGVGGFFWEKNRGDPRFLCASAGANNGLECDPADAFDPCVEVDGGFCVAAGNDASTNPAGGPAVPPIWLAGYPVTADALFITRFSGSPSVSYDWANSRIDNCLQGGPGTGVMVFYFLDSEDNYAVAAVNRVLTPVPGHDLDTLVTGVGPFDNDVPFRPRLGPVQNGGVIPQLKNVTIIDSFTIEADILVAEAGINFHTDLSPQADDPGAIFDTSGMSILNCPGTGNQGCRALINRGEDLCWDGEARLIANGRCPDNLTLCTSDADCGGACSVTLASCVDDSNCGIPGFPGVCLLAPIFGCDPANPADCFGGATGPCVLDSCVLDPCTHQFFGPPITGGCIFVDPTDEDGDGFALSEDCDDDPAACGADCFPGNPEVCDGWDNDCDGITDTFVTFCGVGECAAVGVCTNAADSCTPGPSAPEVCDGVDNNCDGLVDEITGHCGFHDPADSTEYSWPALGGGIEYVVARSPLPDFSSGCTRFHTSTPFVSDAALPALGQAYFYLVRSLLPHEGSWGKDSAGIQRSFICGNESVCSNGVDDDGDELADCQDEDCDGVAGCEVGLELTCDDGLDNDGDELADCLDDDCDGISICEFPTERTCNDDLDNDADGLTDCADPDCQATSACPPVVFTFQDTAADDIADTALYDFFSPVQVTPQDYILFEIDTGTEVLAWCSTNADFYRDQYLLLAFDGGRADSGLWDRWYRSGATGGEWIPDNVERLNLYGYRCNEEDSWCSERLLIPGIELLAIRPSALDPGCEAQVRPVCGAGNWTLTLKITSTRLEACGF